MQDRVPPLASPFAELPRLRPGDRVAILSPSFAAAGRWPAVYALGLRRLREVFGLEPVEFPTTRQLGAPAEARAADLIAAFSDPNIRGVIASIGGDDQVTYVGGLPREPFARNPKPFFGYSDNTHFINHLWLCGVPAYYGGSLFTQYAMQGAMDEYTVAYLRRALFKGGETRLQPSATFNDIGLSWDDPATLDQRRAHEPNEGWLWDAPSEATVEGGAWGGCLESLGELLAHGAPLPTRDQFERIVLFTETSEELPSAEVVAGIYTALGERGILARVRAVLVGRPKAWEFDHPNTPEQRAAYRFAQREATLATIRRYNPTAPVVQNLDIGHTDPQICLPVGRRLRLDPAQREIVADF